MVDAGIAGDIAGAFACALVGGLENCQVDVPIREIIAPPGPAHLLQAKHLLVKRRSLFRVRSAYGDVLDPGHGSLPSVDNAHRMWLRFRPHYTRWGTASTRQCCAELAATLPFCIEI